MSHPLSINVNGILPVRGRPFCFTTVPAKQGKQLMSKPAQSRGKSNATAPVPLGRRQVFEVYSNCGTFEGAVVVEHVGRGKWAAERILYWAQGKGACGVYANDDEEEADRRHMVKVARDLVADKAAFRRHRQWIIDYRKYGLPTSSERMPDAPYTWLVYKPGRFGKDIYRRLWPYCPIRCVEMLYAGHGLGIATKGGAA